MDFYRQRVWVTKRRAFGLLGLIIAILCLTGAVCFSRAEDALSLSASFTPGDLTSPGYAVLTVTLQNNTEFTAEDVSLSPSENQKGIEIAPIEPGETAQFLYETAISQKTLDAGQMDVFVSCTLNGAPVRQRVSAKIHQVSALDEARFTRRVSASAVRTGDPVVIEYRVENTGSAEMRNVTVADVWPDFQPEPFSLAPGESRLLEYRFKATESAVSAATLSYVSAQSGVNYTLYAEKLPVNVETDRVHLTLARSAESVRAGERGEITLYADNDGAFRYFDLVLTEPTLGRIPGVPDELRPGDSFSLTLLTPPGGSAEYTFTLSMRDEAGTQVSFQSASIPMPTLPGEARSVLMTAEKPDASDDAFMLTLMGSETDLKNVRISEKTGGLLRTLDALPAMARTRVLVSCPPVESGLYQFTASFEQNGELNTATAEIAFDAKKEAPDPSAPNVLLTIVQARNLPTLVLILCGAAFAVLVIVAVLRICLKKRRRAGEKTEKFTPVHPKDGE